MNVSEERVKYIGGYGDNPKLTTIPPKNVVKSTMRCPEAGPYVIQKLRHGVPTVGCILEYALRSKSY